MFDNKRDNALKIAIDKGVSRKDNWMRKTCNIRVDLLKWIFVLMMILVGGYFILGEVLLPPDSPGRNDACEPYSGDWVLVGEDGTKEAITIPGKYPAQKNQVLTIESVLPDTLENGKSLCFRSSKQDVEIYVDGVLREEYCTEDTRLFGKTSAVAYVFVQLNEEDAGKVLTIKTKTDSSFSGIFYTIYYGERMGIWKMFFSQTGGELVFAFFTLLLGVIGLFGSVVLAICYRKRNELEYLSWGVLLAAIWLIANSNFRQLLFPNISVIGDMTFFMIMLLPFPFVLYIDEVQKKRYHKWFVFVVCVEIVNSVVCTILHVTNHKDFADTILYMALVCFLAIGSIVVTIIIDTIRGKMKEYWLVSLGIVGSCVGAAIQIILYFERTVPFNGIMVALGLVFMLIVTTFNTMQNILDEEKHKQKAIAAGEAKARFLATMSHEIRTPITAVLGMDVMILREAKDEKIKEYALDIQNAGQSLLDLINDILDTSKIESGKMQIIPEEYDFSSLMHDLISMMSVRAKDRNLDFQVAVDEALPSKLYGDKTRVRQILVNIIGNAVKYTQKGEVVLSVNGKRQGNKMLLHFSVKDTGIGIKQEDMERLFGEFERIEEKRNKDVEGTGLGLNITARLLELMGSQLKVKSVYGVGSEFYFDLEQEILNEEPIGNLQDRIKMQASHYSHDVQFVAPDAEILVVDDNEINRKVFTQLLKESEVRIDEASSGREALSKAESKHYDLIFLDHMMPEMDGVETLHQMKESKKTLCKDTPVIVLTANAISGAREMYLSEGFDDYLSKPIAPEKLDKLLQRMLPEEKKKPAERKQRELEQGHSSEESGEETQNITQLPDVEGMDVNYALLHIPDRDLLKELIGDFYRAIDSGAEELENYYHQMFHNLENEVQSDSFEKEAPLERYRIKVHAMKSASALVGIVSLSGLAKVLEYAARDHRVDVIKDLTPVFLEEWRLYKEKLFSYVEGGREQKQVEDISVILTYLDLLAKAMEEMNIDMMDATMEEIRQYVFENDVQKDMEQLGVAVTYLDGEKAIPLIHKIKEEVCKNRETDE